MPNTHANLAEFQSHLRFEEVNPLCGDRIRVELRLTGNGAVEEINFSGEMCAIAKASASILFASLEGITPSDDQQFE